MHPGAGISLPGLAAGGPAQPPPQVRPHGVPPGAEREIQPRRPAGFPQPALERVFRRPRRAAAHEEVHAREGERRTLELAYDFLLRVRTELHYLSKRPADALTLHLQGQIADRFRYPQATTLRRSEAFMRDYYQHARGMALVTETLFERLVHGQAPASGGGPASDGEPDEIF